MLRRAWPLALAFTLVGSVAHAGNAKKADTLFKEGRVAFDKKDYPTACAKFGESQAIDPAAGTLLNLALCEEKLGQLVPARAHAGEVVAALAPKDDRLPLAKSLVARLDKRLPTLTLSLAPGAPPTTTIRDERDGRTLAIGRAEPMESGAHTLTVRAPGRPDGTLTLTLSEAEHVLREITVLAAPPSDAALAGPSSSAEKRRIVGYAAGALGAVGFATAGVTGALLLSKKSAVDKACPNKNCSEEGLRLLADAEKTPLLPLNTASWILGFAGLGAGAVLVLTSLGGNKAPSETAIVYPTALPGGAGLGALGTF